MHLFPPPLFLPCAVLAQKVHRKEENLAEALRDAEEALRLRQSSMACFQETVERAFGP